MEEVFNFLNDNLVLNTNDNIVIALSGGPDSMALLNILLKIRKEKNINIICAHVNHNLRDESAEEELFVKKYCENNNVIFETTKFDYETKFSESIGHKKRYDYFKKLIDKYSAKYLFTAHHGDDLIETILMRIVRGSSIKGYMGFEKIVKCSNYSIVRPLVFLTKEQILEYNKQNNIPYVIDKSNEDLKYTRNRYRKNILPLLKEENNNVHLKFLQYSEILSEYIDYVSKDVDHHYNEVVINNRILLDEITKLDKIIIRQIIYKWLYTFYGDNINIINMKHIDSIISLLDTNKPNIVIDIPNYKVIKEYNYIYLKDEILEADYNFIIDDIVKLPNGYTIKKIINSDKTDNYVTYLNSKDLKLPLYVRNYKSGDKMSIKNFDGHKKIKDIFINEKISAVDRKLHPIVVDSNNQIIWLPGVKKSSFDSQKDGNYDIILEYGL